MSKTKLILIGGGGHCKSVIEAIESTDKYEITGILDGFTVEREVLGYPVLGGDNKIEEFILSHKFVITVGQIKSAEIRQKIHTKVKTLGGEFATIIANSAVVSKHSTIGEGSVILHQAIVNAAVNIGLHAIINSSSLIEHDCTIGDFCHISTGAKVNGSVRIDDNSFVGSGAILFNNIEIGSNLLVRAGEVVTKNRLA